jgi:hypothetical protein
MQVLNLVLNDENQRSVAFWAQLIGSFLFDFALVDEIFQKKFAANKQKIIFKSGSQKLYQHILVGKYLFDSISSKIDRVFTNFVCTVPVSKDGSLF